MTLIVTIPATDGVVLAADSQLTTGQVRAPGLKLYGLNDTCAWAGAGEIALIQRVEEIIGNQGLNQPLMLIRDQLCLAVKQCISQMLNLDFRTPFYQNNPDALLSLHEGDFVFVENRGGDARTLHVLSNGTAEWVQNRAFATGNGSPFAYALLRKYHGAYLTLESASMLALKVIEEAIEVGSWGLGPPIHVWQLDGQGIQKLDEERIAGLKAAAETLRELEVSLLNADLDLVLTALASFGQGGPPADAVPMIAPEPLADPLTIEPAPPALN